MPEIYIIQLCYASMSMRKPISRDLDPANEAFANLFVAGVDVEPLRPFADAFSYNYCTALPVLEKGLPVLRALGVRALHPTWNQTALNSHRLFISDKDFTAKGVSRIIQELRELAAQKSILVEQPKRAPIQPSPKPSRRAIAKPRAQTHSRVLMLLRSIFPADIANSIAREISGTAHRQLTEEMTAFRPTRQALATWILRQFSQDLHAIAVDVLSTQFNVVDGDGKYVGWSLSISPSPPFEVRVLQMRQIGGRWATKELSRHVYNFRK